ncbi:hypothetical protein A3H85_01245 [Candidatus Daviesbacteria bacterium RIFCSPLOWO2_02_FULL_40_8]|uniref:Uncharacterized protein n=1 Tax=Candidatus Daviesbacteria bacterium RIFCSPLOWO2_01_FULL_40_24 TaxID=1797787 RepID=A0A1F5MKK1_9BACT|nr:MAG: hypothetical protein A2780_00585 [Candidatus Daviesbacteria bacterium RIFCSPHIGHO2_01_FULL_41_45]OGE34014.1 MAG: hypothetical protein A3C32_01100 [Candidatus Daviesbacteria bacterium RIFCSPHIGHO2_02_FULL_41_14]OGE65868.1 MAG: hypothetical protein A3B49_02860 [Candidatus Daviesbacteria bacterium RIFCSPLOWO2_01_FULL_40_24]OGE67047.1 MAG: hypothetical protein A3H85_01245 [Candidatus Daviesbacteria bacterium RIFCSPLOWO2_02_FULL_40_8]
MKPIQIAPLLDKILTSTYTTNDVYRRIRALKQFLLNQLFASAIQSFTSSSESDSAWLSSLGTEFYAQFNQQNIYQMIEALEKQVKSIQPLIIYLPFEIPEGEVVRIGMKIRTDLGKNLLLNFKVDPTLIAGCAIVWNSQLRDYSARARINQNKPQILSIIKEYIHA